jgi:hypothetical protein
VKNISRAKAIVVLGVGFELPHVVDVPMNGGHFEPDRWCAECDYLNVIDPEFLPRDENV